jgi:hypothetical protein
MAVTGDAGPEISAAEVQRRMLWARRQGRPAWLWPDVPIEAWRAALAGIEAAIVAILAGDGDARLEGDAPAVGLAGYTSGMGPLLGRWVEEGRLRTNGSVAAVLRGHLAHNRLRETRMAAAGVELVEQLAARGVETIVLKGAHTGHAYFPEPGARPASDVDLLVAARDAPSAEAAMAACGLSLKGRGRWESTWCDPDGGSAPRSLSYVHAEDPWSADLHSSLNISVGGGAPLANLDRAHPMASGGRWPADPRARVLDQPLLLLHLAAHAGAGWQNLTLLRQVELALVIRQDLAAGRLSWGEFLEAGACTGALGYAYPALHLADKLAPGAVPDQVLAACAAQAPAGVRRALARLTPATAHRVERNSVREHFMWAPGWRGGLRLLASDLFPAGRSWPEFRQIYEARVWRLIRGAVRK